MRRLPTLDPSITDGLANGTMFRIPRDLSVGHPMDHALDPELLEWLTARTTKDEPTHRIIHGWGLIIEFLDDDFQLEYMLTWSSMAEWPEFQTN